MDEVVLSNSLTTLSTLSMARRELSAFFAAVAELFGAEQAEESAEDWLRELMASKDVPASTGQWRRLTVAAAARLANRVNAPAFFKSAENAN